jgi:type I restriction enzyme S subunit
LRKDAKYQDYRLMNKETKNKIIPKKRFPEFKDAEGWEMKEVGEVFEVTRGYVLSMGLVKENYSEETPYPVYSSQTKNNGLAGYYHEYLFEDAITWTTDGANAGDVNFRRGKFYCTNVCGVLINKRGNANDCIASLINSVSKNHVSYVGNPKLMNGVMSKIIVPFPSIKEQQKIAFFLSSIDELITVQSQKLEALKAHKKGLMQQLFPADGETQPKLRFEEFKGSGEWATEKIETYIDLFSGIALKSEEITDDESGIPILRGINITEGRIRHAKDIDKYFLGDLENVEKYLVKENDVVIGMDGSKVGKNVALIKAEDENSILIQRVARIRTNEKSDINYVYQHFLSDKFRAYVDKVNTSSGIPHISAQQIKDFKVGFPPKVKEQKKIASCLSSLDELIAAQGDKIKELKKHKKGLMQDLFPDIKDNIQINYL